MRAKPWLWRQVAVQSYFLVCLYTVSLFWLLLLKTPAALGRQNCLEKELLPLRSQLSVCGRPKQDFYTIAPRNRSQTRGETLLQALVQDHDHWNLKDSCCPLGLAPIPTLSCISATADLTLCSQVQGLPLSDWQKQHWSLVCAFGNT